MTRQARPFTFGHVDVPHTGPFQAHRESPESLPAFPVPTLRTVRRDTRDPLYGDSDGHVDGFRDEPRHLGLPEDALAVGVCIAALMFIGAWVGAFR